MWRAGLVVFTLVLASCGIWQFARSDAAVLRIHTQQIGCCYIEGALHFGRLDGPTSGEFSLDGGADEGDGLRDPIPIGQKSLALAPGRYELTVWERVCNGNCGELDDPGAMATIAFDVAAGEELTILVEFVLMKETNIQVQ